MAFRFNFEEGTSDVSVEQNVLEESEKSSRKSLTMRQAKEVAVQGRSLFPPISEVEETVLCKGKVLLKHVKASYVERKLEEGSDQSDIIAAASERNTDLIPCEYEGGVKLWECAIDLVEHLAGTTRREAVKLNGAAVLELGCGTGLPGIFALLHGASVHFQDYNDEVIEHVTIPNILLNEETIKLNWQMAGDRRPDFLTQNKIDILNDCRFFAGDWGNLQAVINPSFAEKHKYDIILTSETIYNADCHDKLYKLMKGLLRRPHGVAYIAAKTYYFGVGGGTRMFEELVRSDGTFDISACMTFDNGVQREILCMIYKTDE